MIEISVSCLLIDLKINKLEIGLCAERVGRFENLLHHD
jgi:hypothetical protein